MSKSTVTKLFVGSLIAVVSGVILSAAWIGALLNTSRLEDKAWFIVLLVLGLLSFGFIAMLVYALAGPDGTKPTVGQARAGQGAVA